MKSIIDQDEIHKLLALLKEGITLYENNFGRGILIQLIRDWYSTNAPEYFESNQTPPSSSSN